MGVTSELDRAAWQDHLAEDCVCFAFSNAPVNVTAAMLPGTDPDLHGHGSANATHPERPVATLDQLPGTTLAGLACADEQQAAFLLDRGPGQGFLVGLRVSAVPVGDCKFINVWNAPNGTGRSASKVSIRANGTGSVHHLDQDHGNHRNRDHAPNGSWQAGCSWPWAFARTAASAFTDPRGPRGVVWAAVPHPPAPLSRRRCPSPTRPQVAPRPRPSPAP